MTAGASRFFHRCGTGPRAWPLATAGDSPHAPVPHGRSFKAPAHVKKQSEGVSHRIARGARDPGATGARAGAANANAGQSAEGGDRTGAVARRGRRSARGSVRAGTDEAPAKPATVQETARLVSARSRADTIKLALAGVGVIAAVIGLVVVSRRQNAADRPVTSAVPASPPAPIAAPPAGQRDIQSTAGSASAMSKTQLPRSPRRS